MAGNKRPRLPPPDSVAAPQLDLFYLLVTSYDPKKNLKHVSAIPFASNVRDVCRDPVAVIRKLQGGDFLLGVSSETDTQRLLKRSGCILINQHIALKMHPILNVSRGVVRSWILEGLSEDELLEAVTAHQGCTDLRIHGFKPTDEATIIFKL